jgi:nitrile hydratase
VRANALYSLAVKHGIFNMDEYRHAIERMEPRHYLSASYYERSLTSLATLWVEKGICTREELERRAQGEFPLSLPTGPGRPNVETRRKFKIGDTVRVRTEHVSGHVRAPGYVRGKSGVVVGVSPAYPFPDAHAHGIHAEDEPTYDVRFDSQDLWGRSADKAQVHVGVFESYLDRVA